MNKKVDTRDKILDVAQSLVLDRGLGSTTVDAIIDEAGVSKGAFFHYFSSKAELAHALVSRYADVDIGNLEKMMNKAEGLSDDPLQQLLIFVKLFEQEIKSLEEPYPGCLFASYLYQSGLFDEEILEIIHQWVLTWRSRIKEKLEKTVQEHPPAREVDIESLADMLLVIFEGAFVLSQSMNENKVIAQQLSQFHNYLSLLFKEQ
ncbi:MAG: TetR/AcrR family transcriptional regulator [Bacteroidota bacterium]